MRRSTITQTFLNSLLLIVILFLPTLVVDFAPIQKLCIQIIVDILITCFLFMQLKNQNFFSPRYQDPIWKNVLVLAPVLIVFLPFPLFLIAAPQATHIFEFDATLFFLNLLQVVFVCLLQEMLFRMFFFYRIRHENRGVIILISAAIFTAFDLLKIFTGYPIASVLFGMIFTFLLGIILGAIMEYGHCVYLCMGFRILYEFIYKSDCCGLIYNDYAILYSALFLIAAVIYLIVLYFIHFKKKEYYDVQ